MQTWTPEMWQAALIGAVIGFVLAYIVLRLTKGSVKKQTETENELKQAKLKLDEQNEKLEKHFAESAELFKTLIGDYQKLYRHYAQSSDQLLGGAPKGLFTQQVITAMPNDDNQPPRDYSEGSSGLLKAER